MNIACIHEHLINSNCSIFKIDSQISAEQCLCNGNGRLMVTMISRTAPKVKRKVYNLCHATLILIQRLLSQKRCLLYFTRNENELHIDAKSVVLLTFFFCSNTQTFQAKNFMGKKEQHAVQTIATIFFLDHLSRGLIVRALHLSREV